MTIRMTGIISGLDTDSIVKELMSAQSLKKTKIEKKKTKLEWKKEKWEDLNKKLYALYTKQVSKMKLQGSYMTKKVTSSNEGAVTATATSSAASGSHTIEVKKLASSQYVTGKQITGATSKSKLTDLGMTEGTIINVTVGDKTKTMTVGADTTVNDFVKQLQESGLNASFDEKQGRFFISAKESGKDNAFSITTSEVNAGSDLAAARDELETALGSNASALDSFYDNYKTALENQKEKQAAYDSATGNDRVTAWEELQTAKEKVQKLEGDLTALATTAAEKEETTKATNTVVENYVNALKADTTSEEYTKVVDSVDKSYYKYDEDGNLETDTNGNKVFTDAALEKAKSSIQAEAKKAIEEEIANGKDYANAEEKQAAIDAKYAELVGSDETAAIAAKAGELYEASLESAFQSKGTAYAKTDEGKEAIAQQMEDNGADAVIEAAGAKVEAAIASYKAAVESGVSDTTETSGQLEKLGLTNITANTANNTSGVSIIAASDAEVVLDGATLTGSSNNFTAAGITFELKGVTTTAATMNVTNDTDAIYDSIKGFLKEYNSILEEMNTLYNATSARGYEPLTDEEKEAMSDEQIELWENKIKDSLLRRDGTLGGIADALRSAMQTSVTVDGKNYSLASFGIMTSSDYTERGLLHIYGDEDDSVYSDQKDKLKAALNEDPDTVAKVFSGIMSKLSDTMMDKMKKTSLSSALTFYNDTQIKNQIEDYKDDIDKWEDKLKDIEDRYYKQFSAMETAMAKMQSQSNYLSSLMGTSS